MEIDTLLNINTNQLNYKMLNVVKVLQASKFCKAIGVKNVTLAMRKLERRDKIKLPTNFRLQDRKYNHAFKKAWFITEAGAVRVAVFYKNPSTAVVLERLAQSNDEVAAAILREYSERKRVRRQKVTNAAGDTDQ